MTMKKCKICSCNEAHIIYDGLIRDGGLGKYTKEPVKMYQCDKCGAIWHDQIKNVEEYYESTEYRMELEDTTCESDFYRMHDPESMNKFEYTGTTIFRNKVVADIGCGCGAFLDYVNGVASNVVAIEPSSTYREIMDRKGFITYPYMSEAKDFFASVDVVTSFDVIEHVEDPVKFMEEVKALLVDGGQAIIGTPTDAPVMREMLGEIYERELLFSTQHIWILNDKSLKMIAEKMGFRNISIKYYQRYGLNNFIGWIKERKPRSEVNANWLSNPLENLWKDELSRQGLSDYIVLYCQK
ncbi:Methyltransferase domain-containing protein [Lachnospiraceae bacterium]|nr:Methyltransferase domain-containing protein [Lachnospiraceae bacterium]